MKFKKSLNEEFTSDDLYQQLINYIYGELEFATDDLASKVAADIEDYKVEYCATAPDNSSYQGYNHLRLAAEFFAEFLLENAPEVIHEDANDFYRNEPAEDFDASAFIGKPLKDFLKTIDHRTKINISSDAGFDSNGGVGNTAGMSGLAHDAGWYLADKLITDIKVPQDKRFYDYSIFIESCKECDDKEKEEEKEPLTEGKWRYELKSGEALRKAIRDEDVKAIQSALMDAYKEIHEAMPDDFEDYELEDKLEELEILDTEFDPDIHDDEEDVIENWDYELSDFYDLCDELKIWVGGI